MSSARSVTQDFDHVPKLMILVIVAVGLALRIPQISYSFFGDESFSLLRDSNHFFTDSEDRFRPVFFSLLYLWKQFGFHGEVGLRLLPLIFGVAQIPFAYLIGRELNNRRLGLTFTVLVALNPMLIEFSQELRMYSLITLIALIQAWILLKIIRRGESNPASIRLWTAFVILGVLGVYTHLHYWFLLAGMSLTFWRERRLIALRKCVIALATILLLYLPNIPNLLYFKDVRGSEYPMDISSALPKLFAAFTVGFNYFRLPDQNLGRHVGFADIENNFWLFTLVAIPAILMLWRFIGLMRELTRKREGTEAEGERHAELRAFNLSTELFILPVIFAFAASIITGKYFLQPKYIIFTAPFLLLLLAQVYLSFHYAALKKALGIFAAAIVVVCAVHFNMPDDYGRRENWKRAAEILESEQTPTSTLLLLGDGYPLLKYYGAETRSYWNPITIPSGSVEPAEFAASLLECLAGKDDVYYLRFDTAQNNLDPNNLTVQGMDLIAHRVGVIQLNPRLQLCHWRMRSHEE